VPPQRSPERLLAIVDAATEVFARTGFAAAQMADVARAAGVSVGTLYNYVEGKAALLLLCAERPFADITAGRPLPVPAPDRAELLTRLDKTLGEHVRVPALEHALATPIERDAIDAQLRAITGELFDLIATTRVAADAMERSARDAPDLSELFYRRVRVRLLDQLVDYCTSVDHVRPLPDPVTPELAARFVLETVTWWARHRHRDPAPLGIDDTRARVVAIALVTGSLAAPGAGA
jgi:AcrR family transcriptional regulator